jgi:hypothetical protein
MQRIPIDPLLRPCADAKPASELGPAPSAEFLPSTAIRELQSSPQARRRAALVNAIAGSELRDVEEALVVRFEPVALRDGQLLVVAHVVSARLRDLFARRERPTRRSPSAAAGREHIAEPDAEIEVAESDGVHGRAVIRVHRGELGPMTLELELRQGRLRVRASVTHAGAGQSLQSDRGLLEASLAQQGVELGELIVVVERKRSPRRGKSQAAARDNNGKDE